MAQCARCAGMERKGIHVLAVCCYCRFCWQCVCKGEEREMEGLVPIIL